MTPPYARADHASQLFLCTLHSGVVFDDMLSRGVKELCIVRAAELMATRAVDDAHGAPENGVDGVDAAMRQLAATTTALDRQRISPILLIERIGVNTKCLSAN